MWGFRSQGFLAVFHVYVCFLHILSSVMNNSIGGPGWAEDLSIKSKGEPGAANWDSSQAEGLRTSFCQTFSTWELNHLAKSSSLPCESKTAFASSDNQRLSVCAPPNVSLAATTLWPVLQLSISFSLSSKSGCLQAPSCAMFHAPSLYSVRPPSVSGPSSQITSFYNLLELSRMLPQTSQAPSSPSLAGHLPPIK